MPLPSLFFQICESTIFLVLLVPEICLPSFSSLHEQQYEPKDLSKVLDPKVPTLASTANAVTIPCFSALLPELQLIFPGCVSLARRKINLLPLPPAYGQTLTFEFHTTVRVFCKSESDCNFTVQ